MTASAQGTSTAENRKPSTKDRTLHIIGRDIDGALLIEVTEVRGKKTTRTTYGIYRIASDFGVSLQWFKVGTADQYDVLINGKEGQCECMGHLAHGHRTVCKHVAASRVLLASEKI